MPHWTVQCMFVHGFLARRVGDGCVWMNPTGTAQTLEPNSMPEPLMQDEVSGPCWRSYEMGLRERGFPHILQWSLHVVSHPGPQSTPLHAHRDGNMSPANVSKSYDMGVEVWPAMFQNVTLLDKIHDLFPPHDLLHSVTSAHTAESKLVYKKRYA